MILMIAGATHSGKTVLAQRVLEEYKCPMTLSSCSYYKSPFNASQYKSISETFIYGGATQSGTWEFSKKSV